MSVTCNKICIIWVIMLSEVAYILSIYLTTNDIHFTPTRPKNLIQNIGHNKYLDLGTRDFTKFITSCPHLVSGNYTYPLRQFLTKLVIVKLVTKFKNKK
jgi:hypothetical protein